MLANAVKRAGANLQRRIVLLQQFVCRPFGPESDARSCYPRGSLFPHTTPTGCPPPSVFPYTTMSALTP